MFQPLSVKSYVAVGRPAWLHGAKRHLRTAGGILKPLRENSTCFSLFVFSLMRRDQSLTAAVTTRMSSAVTRRPVKSLICSSGLLFFPSPKNTPWPDLLVSIGVELHSTFSCIINYDEEERVVSSPALLEKGKKRERRCLICLEQDIWGKWRHKKAAIVQIGMYSVFQRPMWSKQSKQILHWCERKCWDHK